MWLASPDSRVYPSLLSLSHNGTPGDCGTFWWSCPYPRRIQVLGWFHVAAGYHIVGDYAVGEHLDNNPLVNLTQMPMGASAVPGVKISHGMGQDLWTNPPAVKSRGWWLVNLGRNCNVYPYIYMYQICIYICIICIYISYIYIIIIYHDNLIFHNLCWRFPLTSHGQLFLLHHVFFFEHGLIDYHPYYVGYQVAFGKWFSPSCAWSGWPPMWLGWMQGVLPGIFIVFYCLKNPCLVISNFVKYTCSI